MKSILLATILLGSCSLFLNAENNESVEADTNSSTQTQRAEKQLEKQMKREAKFAQEQTFYKGENHDLGYAEINKESIDSVPLIEPDYDFDMDDVYD